MSDLPRTVSPDTGRAERLPPGQVVTRKWPVLHDGPTPDFDREKWRFRVYGLVEREWRCGYDEFTALPKIQVFADMHCVTKWSKLGNTWEGVSTREVLAKVTPKPEATHVMVWCSYGYSTNLALEDFMADDCLFAWKHDGVDMEPDHGWPLRLVVPRRYAWKSAKWVKGVELMAGDKAGFWEGHGYHMRGDPWAQERFSGEAVP